MDPLISVGAAALVSGYLVAMFKHGWPKSPSWMLIVVAIVSGIFASILSGIVEAGTSTLTVQHWAEFVMQGIVAAATAAGVSRTDLSGEVQRARQP